MVIYLDSDIVVDKPLTKLMEIDFKDLPLLAIEDAYLNKTNHKYPKYPDLKPYFNAGVLVLNIPLWKKENLSNILLKKMKTESNNMIYADQDLLNSLLCKRWKKLNSNYNYQTGVINDLKDKNNKPNIIHYTGENKPWKRNSDVIFKNKYWFYYQLSWQEIFDKWKVK